MDRTQFSHFAGALAKFGAKGAESPEFEIGAIGRYSIRYIPFEHVNRHARLVIVGITPGNNQLRLAYAAAQSLLLAGASPENILRQVKKEATFGGPMMRPNLLRMLRHFRFEQLLGIDDVESLWREDAGLLHATSVVPNAAFENGEMFSGSFADVMNSSLLRECFEDCFLASLKEIRKNALYVGLGPCPREALAYCVKTGVIDHTQVLGAFCHPSGSGGSKTKYYLREKRRETLNDRDPTLRQTAWLDAAYEEMRASTVRLGAGPAVPQGVPESAPVREPLIGVPSAAVGRRGPSTKRASSSNHSSDDARDYNQIRNVLTNAGFRVLDDNKKLGGFVASGGGEAIYVDKTVSRMNGIKVLVHPAIPRERLEHLAGVDVVSEGHCFHSNLKGFPKRLHKGKTETTYGWRISIGTLNDLRKFATAFQGATPA